MAEVLQGSVLTCLWCGGKYNKDLAVNVLQDPTAKEFLKLVKICQSYAWKTRVACFLTHSVQQV